MRPIRILDWTIRPRLSKLEGATERIMRTALALTASNSVPADGASQVAILHHISSIVSSDLSLEKMLAELVALTYETTKCDACLVYLVDRTTNEVVLQASQ